MSKNMNSGELLLSRNEVVILILSDTDKVCLIFNTIKLLSLKKSIVLSAI